MNNLTVKLSNIWRQQVKFLSDMSLLHKLTVVYAIVILIPTFIIGFLSYAQSIDYIKKELANSQAQILAQIKGDIERRMIMAEGMANNIAYNSELQKTLRHGILPSSEALNDFIVSVAEPVRFALNFTEASIYHIGVYFTQDNIPEYANFQKEEKIHDEAWYTELISGINDSLWLYPEVSNRFNLDQKDYGTAVVKLAKRIETIDKLHLGTITLEIHESDMFHNLDYMTNDHKVYVIDELNRFAYPLSARENPPFVINPDWLNKFGQHNGYFYENNTLFSFARVNNLDIVLLSVTPAHAFIYSASAPIFSNILAVTLGTVLLFIITFYLTKVIFWRLKQMVKIMDVAAKGDFNVRIPVFSKDEAGQLAEDFNVLIAKINDLINEVVAKETAQRDAQLAALQHQINPHFIYNTIDSFRMQLELEKNYELAEAIAYFGRMLRYNIGSISKYATLRQEIDYIDKYMTLQNYLHKDRLSYTSEIPKSHENANILRFVLQPIVENSVKHGLNNVNSKLNIKVTSVLEESDLCIIIRDDGTGIHQNKLDEIMFNLKYSGSDDLGSTDRNVGLQNINNRLKLFYGDGYSIKLDSEEGKFTQITVKIPFESGRDV